MMNDDTRKRRSRRQKGEDPIHHEDSNNQLLKRELQGLTRRGGRGGQLYDEANGWEYFPGKIGNLSRKQRYEQNKEVFKKIYEINDTHHEYDDETSVQANATYQLINTKYLSDFINKSMTCR